MSQFHALKIARVEQETRDAIVVSFQVPAELHATFSYQQGQHLTLRAVVDGEELRRSYSICAAVQDKVLRIAIKRTPGGLFSNWANDTLKPGMTLDVMPPGGHFNLPLSPDNRKHYLAFAAGSGITPILSIVKTTLLAEPGSRFTLFYGNRSSSSTLFRNELGDLKDSFMGRLNLVYVMSREQQDIALFNGRIDAAKCREFFQRWVDLASVDAAFICGPEAMTKEVSAALQEHGLDKSQVKFELFGAAAANHATTAPRRAAPGHEQCEVTVIIDGTQSSFTMQKDRESVLDAGLRHGLDMRYSCKGGICSTCRCKVTQGNVDMDLNYALEDYEIAAGFVLSCQSFPSTDRLVVDFDTAE